MVDRLLIKHLVNVAETYTDEELRQYKQAALKALEEGTDRDYRRNLRLALRIMEEEMSARIEVANLKNR